MATPCMSSRTSKASIRASKARTRSIVTLASCSGSTFTGSGDTCAQAGLAAAEQISAAVIAVALVLEIDIPPPRLVSLLWIQQRPEGGRVRNARGVQLRGLLEFDQRVPHCGGEAAVSGPSVEPSPREGLLRALDYLLVDFGSVRAVLNPLHRRIGREAKRHHGDHELLYNDAQQVVRMAFAMLDHDKREGLRGMPRREVECVGFIPVGSAQIPFNEADIARVDRKS